jgi:hypothetical protein
MALTSQSLSSQNLPTNLSPDKQREMLRQMLTIRRFEERASADYLAGKIYGVVHCYIGEEAVAVGVCSALGRTDRIISTHRGHGHCIAKGGDIRRMMAELLGRIQNELFDVGADLSVMERDTVRMRGARPFVFTNLRAGEGVVQPLLEFEATHARHPDVCNQAVRLRETTRLQELFSRAEHLRPKPYRIDQALQCGSHRVVVVNN